MGLNNEHEIGQSTIYLARGREHVQDRIFLGNINGTLGDESRAVE
jgi:hypothetical protein